MNDTGLRRILTVGDLDRPAVDRILGIAREKGQERRTDAPFIAGLVFLTPSLRTRVGFAAAAHRLGGQVIDVFEARYDASMSDPESFEDTLRTVGEVCDVMVVRAGVTLPDAAASVPPSCALINGGDRASHPTQALIDVWTIEQTKGSVDGRRIGLCGDLTMRAARSLVQLLALFEPAEIVLIAPPERMPAFDDVPASLRPITTSRDHADFSDLDVLYLPGFPPGLGEDAVPAERRRAYALGPHTIPSLPHDAVVLSPLPVIDEIDPEVAGDPRVQHWATHRFSTPIRMAVLELALGRT